MILVTVGTSNFPFARMNALVALLSERRKGTEPIIFQYGALAPQYYHPPVKLFPFMPQEQLIHYMKHARVIICHGGPATIYQSLSCGKIPWVFPREMRFGEHLTDHQVEFGLFMAKQHLINLITEDTPLRAITKGSPKTTPFWRYNSQLTAFLDSLTQGKSL